jgi:hypothetical protein
MLNILQNLSLNMLIGGMLIKKTCISVPNYEAFFEFFFQTPVKIFKKFIKTNIYISKFRILPLLSIFGLVFWLFFEAFFRNIPLFRASRLEPKWGNYDAHGRGSFKNDITLFWAIFYPLPNHA